MIAARTPEGNVAITVPFELAHSMIWDCFKSNLKLAHVYPRGSCSRRRRIDTAKNVAGLMIQLSGRELALDSLRTIARRAAMEVPR